MTVILIKRRDTDTHTKQGHVKTKIEIGVMQVQAKECSGLQEPPEMGRSKESFSPTGFRARMDKSIDLDFGLLDSTTVKEYIFVVLSHPIYDNLLRER